MRKKKQNKNEKEKRKNMEKLNLPSNTPNNNDELPTSTPNSQVENCSMIISTS